MAHRVKDGLYLLADTLSQPLSGWSTDQEWLCHKWDGCWWIHSVRCSFSLTGFTNFCCDYGGYICVDFVNCFHFISWHCGLLELSLIKWSSSLQVCMDVVVHVWCDQCLHTRFFTLVILDFTDVSSFVRLWISLNVCYWRGGLVCVDQRSKYRLCRVRVVCWCLPLILMGFCPDDTCLRSSSQVIGRVCKYTLKITALYRSRLGTYLTCPCSSGLTQLVLFSCCELGYIRPLYYYICSSWKVCEIVCDTCHRS